jgi:hypothetical protein
VPERSTAASLRGWLGPVSCVGGDTVSIDGYHHDADRVGRLVKLAVWRGRAPIHGHRPGRAGLVASVLAIALAIGPLPVAASGPAASGPGVAADPGSEVGAMWREANAKLATSDYAGAIVLLTRVYEQISADPDARMLRLRVRWALHEAHLGAHGVDDDPQHLYVARDLLAKGMADFHADDAELRARSEAALVELEARIATLEQSRRDRDAAEQQRLADERAAQAEQQRRADERARAEPPPPTKPVASAAPHGPHRGRLIGGAVAGGIGVIGLAVLAGGFGSASQNVHTFETDPSQRDGARDGIRRGNTIGIAGAVIAAVGLTTAAILIPLSFRRPSSASARRSRSLVWMGVGIGAPARFGWSAHDVRQR